MTAKLIGAVVLVFAATLASLILISREKKRISDIDAYLKLTEFIKFRIEHYGQPLHEILKAADSRLVLACLGSDRDTPLSEKNSLCGKELEAVNELFGRLGHGYKNDEINACRSCIDLLSAALEGAREDYPKKRKLVLTLSFSAVLAVIIIML